MPRYEYVCTHEHRFIKYATLAEHRPTTDCPHCGVEAVQVITAPMLVTVQPDCCYDSPIDGRPITSWAARKEDLARSGCEPYDPGRKQDAARRQQDMDAALDRSVEQTVEAAITKMPTKQRAKLASELIDQGSTLEYTRGTAD